MNGFTIALLAGFALLSLSAVAAPSADFVVSPKGDDNASGTASAPFATLSRAQQAVRERMRSQPQRHKPVVVLVRGGEYLLSAPLVFTPEDSGRADAPVLYTAANGEKPVFSGGVRLSGWKAEADGRWTLALPDVKSGAWSFSQLFVNGMRRYRPRLPADAYLLAADNVPPAGDKGFDTLSFPPGSVRADWQNLNDVEILGFQIWTMARLRIASVDEASHTVHFSGIIPGTEEYRAVGKGKRFLVENVKEALNRPGEWYLDRPTGTLTYLPMPGETPDTTPVYAPRLETLVAFRGDVAQRAWVQHITFRGLTFAHTNWNTPPDGNTSTQAEVTLPAAIFATGARDVAFERCGVFHTGAHAIQWGAGCRDDRMTDCALTDLGGGGVYIGETNINPDAEGVTAGVRVENCLIAHGGRLHPASIGVWIGHSDHNTVSHNEIKDLYYTGISVGWSWGYGPSGANHNLIADNRIYQIGQGVLSDMGGIYTLGLAPGTVLRGNVIHDVTSFSYGGWGIYPDEGSTGLLIEDNVAYRTSSAGFHQHYGKDNLVRNNVFAFGKEAQVMRTRAEDHRSFTFEHNILLADDAPLLGSDWSGDGYAMDSNLYWDEKTKTVQFAGMTLEQWQKKGQDVHSLIADPDFVDPEKGDFRLRPDSPAKKIGFQLIDMNRAGRVGVKPDTGDAPPAFPIRQ
jgi:hypothetical protein